MVVTCRRRTFNLESLDALRGDGEHSHKGRDDPDDEDGRDSGSELSIVFVPGCVQSTNDLSRISSQKIDMFRVKAARRHDVHQGLNDVVLYDRPCCVATVARA